LRNLSRLLSIILPQNKSLRRLRIGITGSFASGKSEALKVFAEAGFFTCSADDIAHGLLEKGNPVSEKVLEAFGDVIRDNKGSISREKLRAIVFNSESSMRELETIMHPAIKSEMENILASHPLCAAENAILVKMDMRRSFDKLLLVRCPASRREKNIQARGVDQALAQKIYSFQKDERYAADCADFVIENNASVPIFREKIKKLIVDF